MKFIATISLVLFCNLTTHAQGLIWSADRWVDHTSVPGQSWPIALDYVSDVWNPTYPRQNVATRIFFMPLSTNDTGRTFFTDALSEPGFAGFVAGLTDGANGYIRFEDESVGGWTGASEQQFLGRSSLAPDLAGYNITQIGFRVHTFVDGYDPEGDDHTRLLTYSLDFYGSPVPEPSTYALLALGAAALLMRRKARKQ